MGSLWLPSAERLAEGGPVLSASPSRLERDADDERDPLIEWIVSVGGLRPEQLEGEPEVVLERAWLLDGLLRDEGHTFQELTHQYAIIQEDDEQTVNEFHEHFLFALESSFPAQMFQDRDGLLERIRELGGLRREAFPPVMVLREKAARIPGLVSARGLSLEELWAQLQGEEWSPVSSLRGLERWLRLSLGLYVLPLGVAGLGILPPLLSQVIGWGGIRASELMAADERVRLRASMVPGLVGSSGLSFQEWALNYRSSLRVSMTAQSLRDQLFWVLDELFPDEFFETSEPLLRALVEVGGLHPAAVPAQESLRDTAHSIPGLVQESGLQLTEVLTDLNALSAKRRFTRAELERWLWVALMLHTSGQGRGRGWGLPPG